MIYTGSFKDIKKRNYDEIWLIVNSLKNIPKGNNIYWRPDLSPQKELFFKFLNMKEAGVWDETTFSEIYVPTFLHNLASSQKGRKALNELFEIGEDNSILLVCYCPEETLCHRKIVKGLLQGAAKQYKKAELVDMSSDYSIFYDSYKEFLKPVKVG